jgi:hypothetical protein
MTFLSLKTDEVNVSSKSKKTSKHLTKRAKPVFVIVYGVQESIPPRREPISRASDNVYKSGLWNIKKHTAKKSITGCRKVFNYPNVVNFSGNSIFDDHRGFVPPVLPTSPAPRFQL